MMSKPETLDLSPVPAPARSRARAPAVTTPMEMLATALERGADPAILEKLMALQERWEANQGRKAFDAAIAEAKADIKPVVKTAQGHSGKYADFASIAREVDPILSRNGLSYRFRTNQTDRIYVTCVLSHRDGHFEETTLAGPPDKSGSKNEIQSIGSTLTYLQRYSLVAALGLSASKDDDGHSAGANVSSETLSDEQIKKLRDALAFKGRDEARFLKSIKVERIEDIFADAFADCLKLINGGEKK